MADAYQAGADMNVLAEEHGVHRTTIARRLRMLGVPLRRQGLQDKDVPDAARLYSEGWSLAQMGQKYGYNRTTVWHALHDHDVPMRPRKGQTNQCWSYQGRRSPIWPM